MKKNQLITIMIFLFTAPFITTADFSDIPADYSNYKAIEYVKSANIISGYSDSTFKPDNFINRAEFTKILINSSYPESEINDCISKNIKPEWKYVFFTDIDKEEWYAKYICVAKINNIIDGYLDKTFKPTNEITFAESAKIVTNTFDLPIVNNENEIWYEPYIKALSEKKSIPVSIGDFSKNITRAEIVEIIWRIKESIIDQDSLSYEDIKLIYDWLTNSYGIGGMNSDWETIREKISLVECKEPDISYNPFLKGTIQAVFKLNNIERKFIFTDHNFNDSSIVEYSCWETSEPGFTVKSEIIECKNGRENGYCKESKLLCNDSDTENDIYIKGTVSGISENGVNFNIEDSCENVSDGQRTLIIINQVDCEKGGYNYHDSSECKNGCENGACIK